MGGCGYSRAGGTTIETTSIPRHGRRLALTFAAALCAVAACATAASAAPSLTWTAPSAADASNHLNSVACPTVSLCVAVDSTGNVTYTVTPTTGGWSGPISIDVGHSIAAVSCPSVSLCFAVDDHGSLLASTAPNSSAWTPATIDGMTPLTAISCPSAALCVAVDANGGVRSSINPGTPSSWGGQTIDGTHRLTAVSCPTTSFCAAVDDSGQVLETATPTSNWGQPLALNGASGGLTSISCTSAGLCVATAANGNVYASANASSGTPTWSETAVDAPGPLNAVSCSDVGACVLGDQFGNAIASDAPASGAPNWSSATVDGHPITALSCLSAGLCVAVDAAGSALAGTLPAPSVTTGTGSASSQTTATVNATVNPNDAALTDCHFDYGPTTAYGSSAPCTVVPSATGGSQAVVGQLSALNASTTYHFRISASSGVTSAAGADATFTTPAPLKPNPSLSGTPAVGNTLTCKSNVTTTASETAAYQWLSDTVAISGATGATYVVVAANASHHLSCQVTIAGDGGSASATSGFDAIPSQSLGKVLETFTGTDKHGTTSASVPVTCSPQADGSCKITLTLTTVQTVHHKRTLTKVGSSTSSIGSGSKRTLTVSLNATGRRLLRSHHSLAVTLTVKGTVLGKLTATLQTAKFSFGAAAKAERRSSTKARTTHAPRRAG
jgi:hypothetical protein